MQDNHASAVNYPDHVKSYLDTEMHHGAIYGPYDHPPFGDNTHISPFMSRDKPDSDKRRIIIDLSWQVGNSVNDFVTSDIYLNLVYKLQYPTFVSITETLLRLGEGACIYKVDLQRAFRQLRIDYNLLCLMWEGSYYADTFCPFGYRGGSMICTRVSDFFRFIMYKNNYLVCNYVDDIIGMELGNKATEAFNYLVNILQELGFPLSPSKLVSPSTECNCLGVMVNTVKCTLAVPRVKLKEILLKCEPTLNRQHMSMKELQSLIGSLMFIHK